MPYILNTNEDRDVMLRALGLKSMDDLFQVVPEHLRLGRALNIPPALTEIELTTHMQSLANENLAAGDVVSFLGGGSYDHFIPAVVDYVASRGEFYTSYTPYQPEVSQGNLQAMFEYQTLITQLTGMEVSNASLYDGGSAMAEAVLMALSVTRRHARVVVAGAVHPEYRMILRTFLANMETEIVTVRPTNGVTTPADVAKEVDDRTACVVVQHPNFFGCLEDVHRMAKTAHAAGSLFIVSVDPISLGVLIRPGDYGADIVVAEGQSLGSPMSFGGPYLGVMACREEFVRRMPGRIAGQTVDRRGNPCWVLTLQTREQHIRREKATSNICTNQGLFALRAAVYLSAMGPHGLREVAELCVRKSAFLKRRLAVSERFEIPYASPTFKEFVVRDRHGRVEELIRRSATESILAGVPLGKWYPDMDDCLLVTVTEKRSRQDMERLVSCLERAAEIPEEIHA